MSSAAEPAPGSWTVPAELAGSRLDRALAEHLDLTRSHVQTWIAAGRVALDGQRAVKGGQILRGGQLVAWQAPAAIEARVLPEPGELRILLEEPDFVVLDKPADLVVHPGAGRSRGTLAHRILAHYPETAGVGGPGRPGIVHRLDRGTSGALVVARNAETHARLARDFAARAIDKRYLAVVWGRPRGESGTIDLAIGRHPVDRKRMAVRAGGRTARTGWRVRASAGPVSLVEFTLHTGRTHQIRVHARALGHPLIGDETYGETRRYRLAAAASEALSRFPRPALHAWKLAFDHPRGRGRVAVTAPPPPDLVALWEAATGTPFPRLEASDSPATASSRR